MMNDFENQQTEMTEDEYYDAMAEKLSCDESWEAMYFRVTAA